MTKIAIVDDHKLFRKSLELLIHEFDDIQVVFDTDDGNLLFDFLKNNKVDLVLLDIQMPKMNGYQICSILKENYEDIKTLIISQLITKEAIHHIMNLGANGYFTKNSNPEHLEVAIKKVMKNDYYFDIDLSSIIKEVIVSDKINLEKDDKEQNIKFTKREIEIIKMISKEMNSQEIGNKLFISKRTVDKHRKNIMEKANTKNIIGVIIYAIRKNLISAY